ncbi:MAG: hypothetical protein D6687_09710 [Acidobacteria bacterium]|jgi:hypothetical protein|nr:MAG: hypothetical protein D6687_09710 [Acidobacteriota bacterium]GIU81300.1 MAG: hypothetical protein KatS3mg006_0364 [Pyrinomonadaceae bacterium]
MGKDLSASDDVRLENAVAFGGINRVMKWVGSDNVLWDIWLGCFFSVPTFGVCLRYLPKMLYFRKELRLC